MRLGTILLWGMTGILLSCDHKEESPIPCFEEYRDYSDTLQEKLFQPYTNFPADGLKAEEFYYLEWGHCHIGGCCFNTCNGGYYMDGFSIFTSKTADTYFLQATTGYSQYCNFIKYTIRDSIGKEYWEKLEKYFTKNKLGCKREKQEQNSYLMTTSGADICVKKQEKYFYESIDFWGDSLGEKAVQAIVSNCMLPLGNELRIVTKTDYSDENILEVEIFPSYFIAVEQIIVADIQSSLPYKEANDDKYLTYYIDRRKVDKINNNDNFFKGTLHVKFYDNYKDLKVDFGINILMDMRPHWLEE